METKVLASILTLGVVSAGFGLGTFAFFSDTEIASSNLFTAGTLNLRLDGQESLTGVLSAANMAPGDAKSGSLTLTNVGTIATGDAEGHVVDLDLKFVSVATDAPGDPADPDAGGASDPDLDSYLILTALTYDGSSILGSITDANADGKVSLAEAAAMGSVKDLSDPGVTGKELAFTVTFDPTGGNDLKGDSVDLTVSFFLAQAGEADLA